MISDLLFELRHNQLWKAETLRKHIADVLALMAAAASAVPTHRASLKRAQKLKDEDQVRQITSLLQQCGRTKSNGERALLLLHQHLLDLELADAEGAKGRDRVQAIKSLQSRCRIAVNDFERLELLRSAYEPAPRHGSLHQGCRVEGTADVRCIYRCKL